MQDNKKLEKDHPLLVEYSVLAEYFGKVITFRFTTAAFFIAAIAFIISRSMPNEMAEYVLLFAMSFGIWIVELRSRGIFDNILHRAWQIESHWANPCLGELPFFIHMTPDAAHKSGIIEIPETNRKWDRTRILIFKYFSLRHISHTLGLDILYLSVMAYSLWKLRGFIYIFKGKTMDPISALLAIAISLIGYNLLRAAPNKDIRKFKWIFAICGCLMIAGSAYIIFCALSAP